MDNQNEQKNEKKNKDESDPLISLKSSSSADTRNSYEKKFSDDKFIWDYDELLQVNKLRESNEEIIIIKRSEYQNFGIRANKNVTVLRCTKSLIEWDHNEFVNIWLLILFALYFWIQLILISAKTKFYDFNNDTDYVLMFIATLGIAVSLTVSAVFLTFYPLGKKEYNRFDSYNFQGIIFMAYALIFAFIASEWKNQVPIFFYSLFFIGIFLFVSMALLQYDILKLPVLIMSVTFFFLLFILDLSLYVTKKQLNVFYLPMLIESLILIIGIVVLFFGIPERFFPFTKNLNLYFTSSIIYTLFIINFIYETHSILYYTFKANSNYLNNDYEWWSMKNIYN